jgi:class 3 adenylate cyclase
MGLRSKLFLVFFTIILALLVFTHYYSNSETTAFETKRITQQLQTTQARFLDRFDTESRHNLKLVQTITSDQKYRSFLQQMRDNYFSFAEEIAYDTDANIVFVVDETIALRGVFPLPPDNLPMDPHMDPAQEAQDFIDLPDVELTIEGVLDSGKDRRQVVALGDSLFNSVFVPLKESLSDDYALGVVSVGIKLDDAWVARLLADDAKDLNVMFHIDGRTVTSDMHAGHRAGAIQAALRIPGETGTIELDGERYVVLKGAFDNAGPPAGYVLTASLDKAMAPFVSLQAQIFAVGLFALTIGVVTVLLLTNRIVNPIRLLVRGTREVMTGNYDYHVENRSKDEVGQLANAFNHMIGGLKEREQIRSLFGKYVHPSIVKDIMGNPEHLKMGGTHKTQTLLFSDIEGFTTISESMDAEQLVGFLNEYLGAMAEELSANGGILDKYLGDGIMAFWGEPFTTENHALQACRAALAMQARLRAKSAEWVDRALPELRMRIGIATGEVVVGNIGSDQARDYTCIGDIVNLSSRLEGVNKIFGTRIIIDEVSRELAGDGIVARELHTVQVMGRWEGTRIFELAGLAGEVTPQTLALIERYEQALGQYRAGDLAAAGRSFERILANTPNDGPSKAMLEECRTGIDSPADHWTPVRVLRNK